MGIVIRTVTAIRMVLRLRIIFSGVELCDSYKPIWRD